MARISVDYRDLEGAPRKAGPHTLEVRVVDAPAPVTGISDAMVLRSGTMLRFAQTLQEIGRAYYGGQPTAASSRSTGWDTHREELLRLSEEVAERGHRDIGEKLTVMAAAG